MEFLGVSSYQNLQALSALLSTQQEEDEDEDCKVRLLANTNKQYKKVYLK